MRRSLAEEPETPDWPESLAVQTADAGNLEPVWRAVEEGFADHWEHEKQPWDDFLHLTTAPDHDFALWFLAVEGDEIAGACLCNPHEWGDRSAGHVNSLSVRPRWRRRGLALAMLLHSFRELRTRGREHVTLFVDAENTTGAVRLYHRAGMHIDQQQDIWNRPLA
jgi:ribosomal protein S18 acetylase RimI-like enzyme